jgi:hypothetical protein
VDSLHSLVSWWGTGKKEEVIEEVEYWETHDYDQFLKEEFGKKLKEEDGDDDEEWVCYDEQILELEKYEKLKEANDEKEKMTAQEAVEIGDDDNDNDEECEGDELETRKRRSELDEKNKTHVKKQKTMDTWLNSLSKSLNEKKTKGRKQKSTKGTELKQKSQTHEQRVKLKKSKKKSPRPERFIAGGFKCQPAAGKGPLTICLGCGQSIARYEMRVSYHYKKKEEFIWKDVIHYHCKKECLIAMDKSLLRKFVSKKWPSIEVRSVVSDIYFESSDEDSE